MQFVKLFSLPSSRPILESGISYLSEKNDDPMRPQLKAVLKIILANSELIDQNCQINVEWIGEETLNNIRELNVFNDNETDQAIQNLTSNIYRFIVEYDLSVKNDLSMELRSFLLKVNTNLPHYKGNAREQIEFARQNMAVAMVKKIINTDDFGSLRNISTFASDVEFKIKGWSTSLAATEQKATRLSDALEKHTKEFNFVGLREGFADLAAGIEKELDTARFWMIVFGVMLLMPASVELILISTKSVDLSLITTPSLIAMSLTTVALTLLLLYFFRIALRKTDSCRAQLIQVRLRMSLCRFIQSYADYSEEFKSKNEGALAKFENLIFSGIVSSDEKLPSSFDGIEQLASLAKSVTGKG
jgi:hypothetical protein